MRATGWVLVGLWSFAAVPFARADEADGLAVQRLQGRGSLGLGAGASETDGPNGAGGAAMLGDYQLGSSVAREDEAGGLRASSGVFLGSRLGLWGGPARGAFDGSAFGLERPSFSLAAPLRGAEAAVPGQVNMPYIGIGYSAFSLKNGWGFSADLGLAVQNPGRVFGGGQSLDDVLRDLRPSPLFQIGASYAF